MSFGIPKFNSNCFRESFRLAFTVFDFLAVRMKTNILVFEVFSCRKDLRKIDCLDISTRQSKNWNLKTDSLEKNLLLIKHFKSLVQSNVSFDFLQKKGDGCPSFEFCNQIRQLVTKFQCHARSCVFSFLQ